jgi:hypothetical protein
MPHHPMKQNVSQTKNNITIDYAKRGFLGGIIGRNLHLL